MKASRAPAADVPPQTSADVRCWLAGALLGTGSACCGQARCSRVRAHTLRSICGQPTAVSPDHAAPSQAWHGHSARHARSPAQG